MTLASDLVAAAARAADLEAQLAAAHARIAELEAQEPAPKPEPTPEPLPASDLRLPWPDAVGVRRGSQNSVGEHERWLGRKVKPVVAFCFEPNHTISQVDGLLNRTWLQDRLAVVTIGLVPKTLDDPLKTGTNIHHDNIRRGLNGEFDDWALQHGKNLTTIGVTDRVVVRLGHEHNLLHTEWCSRGNEANWAKLYRRMVMLINEGAGTLLRYSWCSGATAYTADEVAATYPGDDYVDVVDIDFYQRTTLAKLSVNLQSFAQFAADHGKPLASTEWGLFAKTQADIAAADDPSFVRAVLDFFKQVAASSTGLAWACYFDMNPLKEGGTTVNTYHALAQFPKAAAAYKAAAG